MKLYETFQIDEEFEQDIKDMFVELVDANYRVDIDFLDKGKGLKDIMVLIEHEELFNSNIAKDHLLRLLDYTKIYYEVITHKFAIYKRVPSRTLDGQETFTTDTRYFNEFPDDIDGIECIGIDIIMNSDKIIKEK